MALEGFGLGLRREFVTDLGETTRRIDWLEIVPENWNSVGGLSKRELSRLRERWPLVPHGISMSIGGPEPLNQELFRATTALCRDVDAPFWSDHICHAVLKGGVHINDLLPLPLSNEAIDHVVSRIAAARRMTDVPLVFENPTYYVEMPGGTMSEPEFLRAIFEASDTGMLLDVNNVYVNSQNLGFDPERFIDALPLERVRQLHIAGHTVHAEVIVDSHIGPVPEPVWALYRYTLRSAGRLIPTLLEWDAEIPPLDRLVDELDRARAEAAAALGTEGEP